MTVLQKDKENQEIEKQAAPVADITATFTVTWNPRSH